MTSPPSSVPQRIRIAIIGAGPGGLLLARMLHLAGIEAQVFEREHAAGTRHQGGTLDLHRETGQQALRQAGLFGTFARLARYEGQETRLYDTTGALLTTKPADGDDRPEIDRADLRDLLLAAVPGSSVRWDHRLDTIRPEGAGGYDLRFANGTGASFDVVVGADGAWSSVRPLLSDAVPGYVGSTLYELAIEDADTCHPDIARLVGHGTALIEADGKAIILQRNTRGAIRVYAGFAQARDDERRGAATSVLGKDQLAARFADWEGIAPRLFAAAGDGVRPWPIYALPVGHRWDARPGVTLIGDAAHLMPPAGEGANLALLDAADLAAALTEPTDRDGAVRAFELKMFARSEAAATRAMAMMQGSIEMTAAREGGDDAP